MKITQEDVDKAWENWEKGLELENKFKEQNKEVGNEN